MDPRKRNEVPQSETKEQKNKRTKEQKNKKRKDSVQCTVLTYESHPKMEKSDGFHIAFFMLEKNKDWKKEVSTERATYFSHSTVIL